MKTVEFVGREVEMARLKKFINEPKCESHCCPGGVAAAT